MHIDKYFNGEVSALSKSNNKKDIYNIDSTAVNKISVSTRFNIGFPF